MANDFEWDYDAAGDLMLRSPEIAAICESEAARLTRATGMEYVPDVRMGNQRVSAAGYSEVKLGEGQFKKRGKNGRIVYTERKIREGTE